RDLGRGARQAREQATLAGVRSADDQVLPGPLLGDLVADAALLGMLLGVLDLGAGVADLRLQLRLQLLARLVLGQQRVHLAQAGEAILGGLGLLVFGLGVQVLRGEVGSHGDQGSVASEESVASLYTGTARKPFNDPSEPRALARGIVTPR